MSDEIEPMNQYRQRAARLRSLAADSESPAVGEILLGIASHYEQLVKHYEVRTAKSPSAAEIRFKAHGPAFDDQDTTQMRPKEHASR